MGERRYIISDASKMIDAESHVLRYWEEELEIEIPRNELGHRYYTDYHINLLKSVKELKEQGFQLKAIKMLLPEITSGEGMSVDSIAIMKEELNNRIENLPKTPEAETENRNSKMEQFQFIISTIVAKAMKENNPVFSKEVSDRVTENVIKEIDYLVKIQEEKEEERFKKMDELIRNYQNGLKETAYTSEKFKFPKKTSKFYKKNKRVL